MARNFEYEQTFLENVRREAARRTGADPGQFTLSATVRFLAHTSLLLSSGEDVEDQAPHYLFESAVHQSIAEYFLRCAEMAGFNERTLA